MFCLDFFTEVPVQITQKQNMGKINKSNVQYDTKVIFLENNLINFFCIFTNIIF